MKNKIIMIFCFIFLCGVLCAAGSTETSTKGDKGSDEKMAGYDTSAQVPRRTVVGNIVVLDMLDVLDVDVVALPTTRRKIDPKHQNKPRIGNPMNPDIEQLKSVDPDLFVTTGDPNSSFGEQLKAAGIPAAFLKTSTYNDFLDSMQYLGEVYKKQDKAEAYVQSVKNKVTEIINANRDKKKPKVLILFGTPGSMSIATPDYSFTGNLVKLIGGQNIWSDGKIRNSYAPINFELIKAENPDVILRMTHVSPEQSVKMFEKEFSNEFWSKLDAVKNGKVYDLDNEHFGVAGNIHITEAVEILSKYIYGA